LVASTVVVGYGNFLGTAGTASAAMTHAAR